MASSRMARFATEVAPAQFVIVMRRRATKMLDTIQEEEIHATSTASSNAGSSDAPKRNGGVTRFTKGVHKSISIFGL
uniref:Uncharacterized protein n=1 Tax=Kalanchoe fedtschenkoi TaxID=63787 RepID=A0A7N0RFU5_KALFE